MINKIITTSIVILMFAISATAKETRKKIILYNVDVSAQVTDPDSEEYKDAQRFQYLTTIIPNTIGQRLRTLNLFTIQRINEKLPLEGNLSSRKNMKGLREIGKKNAGHYIISGDCTIDRETITINLNLVNLKKKYVAKISMESDETGAELKRIIDNISAEIEKRMEVQHRKDLKEDEKEQKDRKGTDGPSPYNKFYQKLTGLSFGITSGYFFILGKWKNIYSDSGYISPYLSYDILQWVGVSVTADYLPSSGRDENNSQYSYFSLWGFAANADFSLRFLKYLSGTLSAGFGASFTRLTFTDNTMSSFFVKPGITESVDPYLTITAAFGVRYKALVIRVGASYKGVIYADEMLHAASVFAGIGYHL